MFSEAATVAPKPMQPYYEEAGIAIYHGDCREVLPSLPSSFNILLTSPPYNVGLNYTEYNDRLTDVDFIDFNRSWLTAAFGTLAESARVYVVLSDRMLWWFKPLAEEVGLTWAQLLAWCKPNLASGRIGGDWNAMVEWILLFRKGPRSPMLNGADSGRANTHNYFVVASPQSNWVGEERKSHPAQWPLEITLRLLARTPGRLVMDPFCGSGSALVAAKRLGREAIGIDVSERSCETAALRLCQATLRFQNG